MLPNALHIMARPTDNQTMQKLNYLFMHCFIKSLKCMKKSH